MKYVYENNIFVILRGLGIGLVGVVVLFKGGIVIDFSKMNKILELDEENFILILELGVLLMEIGKYVEEFDLFYLLDLGEKLVIIGGNININVGGMRVVKYGVIRDYVRGLEVVFLNGEVVNLGGKVVKNSFGYLLKDLIIGFEGILGIVIKVILRLFLFFKKVVSLFILFESFERVIEIVFKIIKFKLILIVIEFM